MAIPKYCSRQISELDYFSEELRRNFTRSSEQNSGSRNDIGGRQCLAPLNPFSMVVVGTYELSFTSQPIILQELAEASSESRALSLSFDKETTEE